MISNQTEDIMSLTSTCTHETVMTWLKIFEAIHGPVETWGKGHKLPGDDKPGIPSIGNIDVEEIINNGSSE